LSAVVINLLGGAAVLGSYAWGFRTLPDASAALWGGVPPVIRPLYTACMFLAAGGYFLFTYYILFDLPANETRIAGGWGYSLFNFLYAAILVPSALWLPMTSALLGAFNPAGRRIVQADLWIVALASLALLLALISAEPRSHPAARRRAIVGCALFCLQTVVLDAIVWSLLFPS
jgi:hypothetical protein